MIRCSLPPARSTTMNGVDGGPPALWDMVQETGFLGEPWLALLFSAREFDIHE